MKGGLSARTVLGRVLVSGWGNAEGLKKFGMGKRRARRGMREREKARRMGLGGGVLLPSSA